MFQYICISGYEMRMCWDECLTLRVHGCSENKHIKHVKTKKVNTCFLINELLSQMSGTFQRQGTSDLTL